MPYAVTEDDLKLYYEESGSGATVLFVHEFAGDHRSWEPQVRYFARRYRCVTYDARGYPSSDVPVEPERYSQERAVADARHVAAVTSAVGRSAAGTDAARRRRMAPLIGCMLATSWVFVGSAGSAIT